MNKIIQKFQAAKISVFKVTTMPVFDVVQYFSRTIGIG